jgi:hypothetical protein
MVSTFVKSGSSTRRVSTKWPSTQARRTVSWAKDMRT